MEELICQAEEKSSTAEGTAALGLEDTFTDPRNQGCQEGGRATLIQWSRDCGGHVTARRRSQNKRKRGMPPSLSRLSSSSSGAQAGHPHWELQGPVAALGIGRGRGRERGQMAASVTPSQPRGEGITALASHTRKPRLRAVEELARVPKPAA